MRSTAGARCQRCLAGLGRHGAARSVLSIAGNDGCFAEYVTVPVRTLHRVPGGLPGPIAAFAEPLAGRLPR